MDSLRKVLHELNLDDDRIESILEDRSFADTLRLFNEHHLKNEERYIKIINSLESHKRSPFLKKTVKKIEFKSVLLREAIVNAEIGRGIDETMGSMYYFKEKAREMAHFAGLDSGEVRSAFTEGIQNIIEHGHGDEVEITILVNDVLNDNSYLEMSFKHKMDTKKFYTLKDANISADNAVTDLESARGRGEFMMREIMDERKFINGFEKLDDGTSYYFFKRIMRKYKKPRPKSKTEKLSAEFKRYIDSLQDYSSAMFVRMDYFSNKKEVVLSENRGTVDKIQNVMDRYNYRFIGSDRYRGINFTFWENDLSHGSHYDGFDNILTELRLILNEAEK